MKRLLALACAALLLSACQTNDQGKRVVDPEAVRLSVMLTCALAPTAAQIVQLYTDNKDVKTTDQAVALICAAALPIVKTEIKP